MASTFKIISIVALVLGVLSLIAAAVIFVKQKIWIVMADLSGKTAQASIERLRSQSGQPAPRKRHHSYVVNSSALKRGKGTDKLQGGSTEQVGKRFGKRTEPLKKTDETVPLKKDKTEQTAGTVPLYEAGGTVALDEGTVTLESGTAVLPSGTVILENGTTVLNTGGTTVIEQTANKRPEFNMITDIVLIHTSEKLSLE